MPYSSEISRANKGLVLFLLDQSRSMEDFLGVSKSKKMEELAAAVNGILDELVQRCTTDEEGLKDYFDIGVIGYCTDKQANPEIESALNDKLRAKQNEQMLVTLADIRENAVFKQGTQIITIEETGEIVEQPIEYPVWVEAKARWGTPMCRALLKAIEIVDAWIPQHQTSFPPIVINISDGEESEKDVNPVDYANSLKDRRMPNDEEVEGADGGKVVLFNCHLSDTKADAFMFPHSSEILPDKFAELLFDMSSELPPPLFEAADNEGFDLKSGAKGMAFNADMVALVKFLDIGTRVNLR